HLTDAKGRKVDFRNAVFIMTSNLGSDLIRKETAIGFSTKKDEQQDFKQAYERMKDKVLGEVKRFFRPEFLNRIDATVVFHSLNREHILQIVDLMLKNVRKQVQEKMVDFTVTQGAREWLAEKGWDPNLGARPLRRLIQNTLEDRLSEELLAGKFKPGDTVVIDREGDELVIRNTVPVEPETAATRA
ncbi:MAG: ATP-dependent Clp protease ATP-binding subunit, partial [SAR202 cluster bacterium]|nr:ATP-dependent Clp protease ATP-binding subunit [SAR202 cluster bacterium]